MPPFPHNNTTTETGAERPSGRSWSSYRHGYALLTLSMSILFDWFR